MSTHWRTASSVIGPSRAWVLAAVLLLTAAGAYSQTTYATITGTVSDPSGAIMPGATLTAVRVETNISTTTTSNESGAYTLAQLAEGTYKLRVQAAGFNDVVIENIQLTTRDTRRIDVTLQVGGATTSVEVSAGGASLIETENAKITETLNAQALAKLPMNARWLWSYFQLVPNMLSDADGYRIGGGTGNETNFSVDGTSMNDGQGWAIGPQLNYMGTVGEVIVDTTNNSAEFGGIGRITVTSRSGDNQFHGSIFDDYWRASLGARNSFAATSSAPEFHIWGFETGGPVYLPKIYNGKNKTFFFVSFERSAGSESKTTINPAVPLPSWRDGDFSRLLPGVVIYDPTTKQPFPGNRIPSSRINNVSKLIQDRYYPLPNMGDNNVFSGSNYQEVKTMPWVSPWLGSGRFDHHFSEKDFIFGRTTFTGVNSAWWESNLPTVGLGRGKRTSRTATIAYTHVFSPSVFNEFRWGLSFNNGPGQGPVRGQEELKRLGLVGLAPNLPDVPGILQVSWSGIGLQSIGQWNGANPAFRNHIEDFQDHLSWYRGRHSLRFGVEMIRIGGDEFQIPDDLYGSVNFSQRFTSGGVTGMGHPYADFLLGIPSSATRSFPSLPIAMSRWQYAGYVHDQIKLHPRLTLTLGLRYEQHRPWQEAHGRIAAFEISRGSIVVPDKGLTQVSPLFPKNYVGVMSATDAGLPKDTLVRTDRNNFGPRLGLAWRVLQDTVLSAGYGITYEVVPPTVGSDSIRQLRSPFMLAEPEAVNPEDNPWMFPRVFPERQSVGISEARIPSAINPDILTPRSHQYSLTLQHRQWNTGFKVYYAGTAQRHGTWSYDYNSPVPDERLYVDKPRAFPKYGEIMYRTDGGGHQYHSLNTEVLRSFSNGLQFQLNWTWARDLYDLMRWDRSENAYDRARERAVYPSIPTHRVTGHWIYDLPFGKGKRVGSAMPRWANLIAGGWTLSGAMVRDSGRFLTPYWEGPDPTGTAYTDSRTRPVVTIRPDQIGNPNLPESQRTTAGWFNPAAFAAPPIGRFGTSAKGVIKGPSERFWNAGLQKEIKPSERGPSFVFEMTARNVFNHANYDNPDTVISNVGSAGRITWANGLGDESAMPRTVRFGFRLQW